jgi:hypothetical protein
MVANDGKPLYSVVAPSDGECLDFDKSSSRLDVHRRCAQRSAGGWVS